MPHDNASTVMLETVRRLEEERVKEIAGQSVAGRQGAEEAVGEQAEGGSQEAACHRAHKRLRTCEKKVLSEVSDTDWRHISNAYGPYLRARDATSARHFVRSICSVSVGG